jgi:PTH1 family peptidyl-tRNA hydrolase
MASDKWLIVGLGNPGTKYEGTRHNLGFAVIDELAVRAGIAVKREECRALIGQGALAAKAVELAKPQTFMNLSGESLSCFLKKQDRAVSRLIVVSDDLAIPLGTIRVRPKGSHGGHNGLRSIISCIATEDFVRVRVGIGPEHPIADVSNFVLERFAPGDRARVDDVVKFAASAVEWILEKGIESAMGEFN